MWFLHHLDLGFICPILNILVLTFEEFTVWLDFEFEFESVLN